MRLLESIASFIAAAGALFILATLLLLFWGRRTLKNDRPRYFD